MGGNDRKASIEIDADTADALRARAAALGVPLDAYLRQLVSQHIPTDPIPMDSDGFDRWLDELSAGVVSGSLPVDFSRSDIYSDHD